MPVGSAVARNAYLDATLGASQHAGIPDPMYLALFGGDPLGGGTELTPAGGYARVPVPATGWAASASGVKATNTTISLPISSGAWSLPATHVALFDALTGGNMYDVGTLGSSVTVSAGGAAVTFAAGTVTVTT